jgi:hypothetical protein
MPKNLSYEIILTHVINGEQTHYKASSIVEVVRIINNHYGLELVTDNSVNRLIGKKQKMSRHHKGINIIRRQNKTASFPNGIGSQYPPTILLAF